MGTQLTDTTTNQDGTCLLFNEHTKIITVIIVVHNIKRNKHPQAIHLASSEIRALQLGEVIETNNCDDTNM